MIYRLLAESLNHELSPAAASELSLENVAELHARLGFPERTFPVIHITGTKGKGSTAAMFAAVLHEAGLKVGLYTSPHVVSLEERIQIDGQPIPEARLDEILEEKLRPIVEEMAEEGKPLTFFELLTVAAFEYFAEETVDFAVVEVGMGGRNDATNICTPCLTVLTNVALDHTKELGETFEEIAREKAGIIKREVPLIVGKMAPESLARVRPVIEEIAVRQNAPVAWAGTHFPEAIGPEIELGMPGEHQRANAAIVCKAATILDPVTPENLWNGLKKAKLPGRLEVVSENPTVILDAAHTPDSMAYTVEWVHETFQNRPKTVLFAAAKDKNWRLMLNLLLLLDPRRLILTEFPAERAASSKEMVAFLKSRLGVERIPDPRQAYTAARKGLKENDVLLVTGSFFLLREICAKD